MNIQFKKAAHKDLPQIVKIYNQIIPSRLATADLDSVNVEQREEWFASFTPTHPLWKIENDEGQMIGWVGLEPFYGRPAYEHTSEIAIYIDQNVRHQGIGRQAIEFVISQLPQLKISAIVAYVFGHNIPSLKLFREFGFEEWGKLPRVAELDGIQRDLVILGRRFDLSV
ncbi:GNAT family N-acetyltransferase [Limosilactobacillus fastidiosus]|uniref:N-acetyltransferase n=1 Tax=Limosilactobacillus fastidiosus TaxID=2759855 RepID=A0A7W3YCZ9_9LACO|nr:GNAT family N-acetyltransferase [Limosilactobacillus fastidiosus]MBB1062728.1 N-acetyltransferase [Limosilactobacillus fastidiosus]MBB1086537.1 N-acetyltransferase [Limosilactobacillus fastidiosus]MCD7084859.1 N-acetyltransferase family protein [Limosilactobacillus fastidiosus]MCD7085320.1 N-acetyltransferase family protein [Limosilactobacillus fastidiosus]MCD7115125.1 N-acetyltransferase family protein [Limosilactobacillus fastidiosus]